MEQDKWKFLRSKHIGSIMEFSIIYFPKWQPLQVANLELKTRYNDVVHKNSTGLSTSGFPNKIEIYPIGFQWREQHSGGI